MAGRSREETARFWSMRHLWYRYQALSQIFSVSVSPDPTSLGHDARRCLARLHYWMFSAGMAKDPARSRTVAESLSAAASTLAWPQELTQGTCLLVEEIAPAAMAADGCFTGGEWLRPLSKRNEEEVLNAMLTAAEGSPLERLAKEHGEDWGI
eukprot:gb/GFBE01012460.1/.p1 GENE.gb/GFBE01012460.1/~~gb/GFBE01012460.1/.p1  ORF type:complete len:153 (+),score=25.33 gb/GFBE01012460.1/:3-461(+)